MEILLNNKRGGNNVNVDNSVYVELSTQQSLLPANGLSTTVNQYEVYLDERNKTTKYKLFFNIAPYMSNVLFNTFTEIVGNVGKSSQFMLKDSPITKTGEWTYNAMRKPENGLTRYEAIRDTEYSHPLIGNFEYQCGIDIFNTHYLRSNGYFHIQKCYKDSEVANEEVINTIEDYLSYNGGKIAKHFRETPNSENPTENTTGINSHLFNHDNITTMYTAFVEGLKEENGWFGFTNKTYANDLNHTVIENGNEKQISVNKCINNKGACEFVDLYPTRKEFSFIPTVNENYNNRLEYNWDWTITYPYQKVNGVDFEFFSKDGLKIAQHFSDKFAEANGIDGVTRDESFVYFRTIAKHGLKRDDLVKITYNGESFSTRVIATGNKSGQYKEYYFALAYDDLVEEWGEGTARINFIDIKYVKIPADLYVCRIENGIPCEYYVRKFKELGVFKSSISKAGFSKTIYNDPIAQIIYSDDIDIKGKKNHLGLELDEIFLTIMKKNVGTDAWYTYGNANPVLVEQSHCFGNVSTGFNFEKYEGEAVELPKNHNVRYYHECDNNVIGSKPIQILDDYVDNVAPYRTFIGDFVEFSPSTLTERVLEVAYHRFNTAQRERTLVEDKEFGNDFSKLKFDELVFDDNDFSGSTSAVTKSHIANFTVTASTLISQYANISPEGYIYKAHYGIKLKEYSNVVNTMTDLLLELEENVLETTDYIFEYKITTKKNYGIRMNDILIVYDDKGNHYECTASPRTKGKNIMLVTPRNFDNFNLTKVFVKNSLVPENSYYLPDGSGKRIWKNVILDSELPQTSDIYNRTFANGAFYINTNINFYLRRQDPDGIYGLRDWSYNKGDDDIKRKSDFTMVGLKQTLPDVEYKINNDYNACEV